MLPMQHQANSFPVDLQGTRLHVVHEGIDTQLAQPFNQVEYLVRDVLINRSVLPDFC